MPGSRQDGELNGFFCRAFVTLHRMLSNYVITVILLLSRVRWNRREIVKIMDRNAIYPEEK